MNISFTAYGHPNITAKHRNTVEITREKELGKEGDCIIGVNADFSPSELKEFAQKASHARMTIQAGKIREEVSFETNKDFSDAHEIVIRKTDFISGRTLGIKADRAAKDLKRGLVEALKKKTTRIRITLTDW